MCNVYQIFIYIFIHTCDSVICACPFREPHGQDVGGAELDLRLYCAAASGAKHKTGVSRRHYTAPCSKAGMRAGKCVMLRANDFFFFILHVIRCCYKSRSIHFKPFYI